jgi:hypothetical protein
MTDKEQAKWDRIAANAQFILDLSESELPEDATLASAEAERAYRKLAALPPRQQP